VGSSRTIYAPSRPEQATAAACEHSARPGEAVPAIAYVMSRYPLLTETFILREMLELERQGSRILVFPLLREQPKVVHEEVKHLAAEVHYTPFLSLGIVAANLHFLRRDFARYLRLLGRVLWLNRGSANLLSGAFGIFPKSVYFARLMERRGVRHLHAHYATHPALAAYIVSELTGIGFSFTAHAHDIFLHQSMLAEKVEAARFVVAISEFNKTYLLRHAPTVAPDKIHVVHCGIEPGSYADEGAAGTGAAPVKQDPLAVCVASLQPYKGIRHLIAACAKVAARVSGFRCLVIGDGADRQMLTKMIAGAGLQDTIQLLGGRPQHDVALLLRAADLFVLPSVVAPSGQMEGIPVALMEAMASRLPVVSTRLSGIPELVEDGVNGLLVPPADETALADAIVRLCQEPELRRAMGEQGRRRVIAEFELRSNVAQLGALFAGAAG